MRSRRDFLGLLAAAPVIGPALAKAAVERQPRFVSAFSHFADFGVMGEIPSEQVMTIDDYARLAKAVRDGDLSVSAARDLLALPPLWDVPNRLYGAAITPEGDAI